MRRDVKIISGKVDITERTVAYSIWIIKLYRQIAKNTIGQVIGKQILRSTTSIGANVHEAQGAQSKADFIAKMPIAHKEAYETYILVENTSRGRTSEARTTYSTNR